MKPIETILLKHRANHDSYRLVECIETYRLFMPGAIGGIRDVCSQVYYDLKNDRKREIDWFNVVIAYVNGKPVGSCICTKTGEIHCFVKESYRRRNIGRMLVRRLQKSTNLSLFGNSYTTDGVAFFRKLNIHIHKQNAAHTNS